MAESQVPPACAHAVAGSDVVVVELTQADPFQYWPDGQVVLPLPDVP